VCVCVCVFVVVVVVNCLDFVVGLCMFVFL